MYIFGLIFILLMLWGIKPTGWNGDYLAKPTTDSVKGVFAVIILFSHSRGYIPANADTATKIPTQEFDLQGVMSRLNGGGVRLAV